MKKKPMRQLDEKEAYEATCYRAPTSFDRISPRNPSVPFPPLAGGKGTPPPGPLSASPLSEGVAYGAAAGQAAH
jgi:hypothetical protein